MNKNLSVLLAVLLTATMSLSAGGGTEKASETEKKADKTVLRFGSWRSDDVVQINELLAEFRKNHPTIEIEFQPTIPQEYNATLRLQLESGTGPDIMYARSFVTGANLYKDGYLSDLSDLPELKNFTEGNLAPWQTDDGVQFALPLAAVSHGVYYNMDIFKQVGVTIPNTWEDFLTVCQKIKDAGIIPVANSLGDEWDINEVVFQNLTPGFIGGMKGRLEYESGKRPFNDADMTAIFQAMKDLEPYLPEGYDALTYNDSNALFATGQASMYFDGSWSISTYDDVDFEWSVFPPPAPTGKKTAITFHADAGIAVNAATEFKDAALTFIKWLASKDGTEVLGNKLPTGFFPMANFSVNISDIHTNAFLKMNEGRETDVRFTWPVLMAGEPSAYVLIQEGAIGVIKGEITPKQAADNLQKGLTSWYKP